MTIYTKRKTPYVMKKLSKVRIVNYSVRVILYLFSYFILCPAFLGSPVVVGQHLQPQDSQSVLEFTAQPQHSIAIMEGHNLVYESAANVADFQLADNQNFAIIEADDKVVKLPPSYQIPGNPDIKGDKYLLPFNLLAKLTDNSTVSLGVILINSTPMEIDDTGKQFKGNLVFRLLNRNNPTHPGEDLRDSVFFDIYSQELDLILPQRIGLKRTNTSSPEINCNGDRGLVDSVDVKIVTDFKPEGYVFHLDIKPYLEIMSKKNTILGMGIENANMILMLQGTTLKDSIDVALDASLGSVDPNQIMIHSDRPGQFKVRSAGLGDTFVSAHSPNIKTIEKSFIYVFPWLFILMALIGGILGTLARTYLGTPGKLTLSKVVLGAIYGFIGAIAWYVLGINLLSFDLSPVVNEFGAMGVSALISLFATSTKP